MTRIALICPTRGRPVQFRRMVESAIRTAHDPDNLHVYFYIADCDKHKDYYPNLERTTRFVGHDWPTVMCSNYLAQKAEGSSLFFMCADDTIFSTPHWDKALLDAYDGKPHVYSLLDSRSADGTPHPVLTKEFINALGFFMCPIFLHWFVDSWAAEIAKANNCFTHLKDYLLIHDKGSDHGQPDSTHTRIRDMGWQHRDAYVAAVCQDYLESQKRKLAKCLAAF